MAQFVVLVLVAIVVPIVLASLIGVGMTIARWRPAARKVEAAPAPRGTQPLSLRRQ